MTLPAEITEEEVRRLYERLRAEAKAIGYYLNPDEDTVRKLLRGLLINERRYGYPSCPCRLATGESAKDRDIICPCDYRDADLDEYHTCYCALYVSSSAAEGKVKIGPIPERRPSPQKRAKTTAAMTTPLSALPLPVWRCRVCGYLCARQEPPESCPICKAKKERFERFI